jgi:hypothetical protein
MKIKYLLFIFIVLPLLANAQTNLSLFADSIKSQTDIDSIRRIPSIVDKINKEEQGKGKVKIIQNEAIDQRIGRPGKTVTKQHNGIAKYVEMAGWRILVYSGNNQRVSKNEAFKKESNIKSIFPELGTYVTYNAPFWRLKVGDFQTYQDARVMLIKLRDSFPSIGREMSIIKEKIMVKKN